MEHTIELSSEERQDELDTPAATPNKGPHGKGASLGILSDDELILRLIEGVRYNPIHLWRVVSKRDFLVWC